MSAPFLWLAATTGFLSLLTPCVFPMVPVTLAYFSAPNAVSARRLDRAIFFGLGIIATFTVLGIALAAIFGAAGLNRFAADARVNLVLAVLFLGFAANLFGWLATPVPWRAVNAVDRSARKASGGSLGALLMGATFTLTSVTCTAPFVGTLLVLAARGSWVTPIAGMLVYSTAFAIPFVVLALVPRHVARLPRSGGWLRTLRVTIGILEIGAAVKFISNADLVLGWGVFTRATVLAVWGLLALTAALYVARHLFVAPRRIALGSAVAATALLATALWLGSGIRGRKLGVAEAYLPPDAGARVLGSLTPAQWMLNDYPSSLAVARTSGQLVFVDFTGYTCTNCRWMEANIFSRPDVAAELNQFVLSRLYTDGEGEIYERQQRFQDSTFGTVALPLYAVVDADGRVRDTFTGLTRDPAEFISFLQRARLRPATKS